MKTVKDNKVENKMEMKKRKRIYKKKDVTNWEKMYPKPKREKRTPKILFPFPANFDRVVQTKK